MRVLVVDIRVVGMAMGEHLMAMPMRMGLGRMDALRMLVLVMLVVDRQVIVRERIVRVSCS